eukprot:1464452-Prymnesium_polylepis.1
MPRKLQDASAPAQQAAAKIAEEVTAARQKAIKTEQVRATPPTAPTPHDQRPTTRANLSSRRANGARHPSHWRAPL